MFLGDTLLELLFRFIVNTVYGAYLPRSYVGSDGLLRQHFPENVCLLLLLLLLLIAILCFPPFLFGTGFAIFFLISFHLCLLISALPVIGH